MIARTGVRASRPGKHLYLIMGLAVALLAGCMKQPWQYPQQQSQLQNPLPASLANKVVRVIDLPDMGNKDAALALVEVTDYECPFCQAHFRQVLPLLKQEFIDSGVLAYYILDYPAPGHAVAEFASVAASCAGDQQAYWQFHDALFERSYLSQEQQIHAIAADLQLDARAFDDCLERRRHGNFLGSQRATALGLGIAGTPTFLLGRLNNGRVVTNVTVLPGMQTMEQFRQAIGRYQYLSGSSP